MAIPNAADETIVPIIEAYLPKEFPYKVPCGSFPP
jgi:hypothetical protein